MLSGKAAQDPADVDGPPVERLAGGPRLLPQDELVFPLSKGAFAQYRGEGEKARELRIFHRDTQIAFEDPCFFAFGEALIRQSRFRAGEAVSWGGLDWPKVRPMLERLIEAGVLRRSEDGESLPPPLGNEPRASPHPPGPCRRAMTWDDSEEILRRICGDPLEAAYLELAVPIFRIAHMYVDADGRQIGEANVFPRLMRMDRPTLWRTCPYSGSRYQPEKPMNVTALRIMRTHWRQVMAVVRRVSDAYRARFPEVAERGWTVGDIERMTVCVEALPGYLLLRRERRVDNGRLHPALSTAFRLIDGPRTVMHDMLFSSAGEPARPGDTPITGAEIHAYAERHHLFETKRAVCAGPPAMIDDFLAVILDGEDPRGGWPDALDPEVAEALEEVEAAVDYGLTGLQAFCAAFSIFPASAAARAELEEMLRDWKGGDSPGLSALRAWLEGAPPAAGRPGAEALRGSRLATYDDLYRQCGFGLTGRFPEPSLLERFESLEPLRAETQAALQAAFARLLAGLRGGGSLAADLAAWLGRFIAFVQAAIAASLEVQGRINALLGRDPPVRPFMGRDLVLYGVLNYAGVRGRSSERRFLVDDVATLLGVTIDVAADGVKISPGARESLRSLGAGA